MGYGRTVSLTTTPTKQKYYTVLSYYSSKLPIQCFKYEQCYGLYFVMQFVYLKHS